MHHLSTLPLFHGLIAHRRLFFLFQKERSRSLRGGKREDQIALSSTHTPTQPLVVPYFRLWKKTKKKKKARRVNSFDYPRLVFPFSFHVFYEKDQARTQTVSYLPPLPPIPLVFFYSGRRRRIVQQERNQKNRKPSPLRLPLQLAISFFSFFSPPQKEDEKSEGK